MTLVRSIPLKLCALAAALALAFLSLTDASLAQDRARNSSHKTADESTFGADISGMYTFLREGEFVQITVEEGKLSGFVSRYGDRDSDRDAFLDQFFSKASLDGRKITFTTKPLHGTWYEFAGDVGRGEAKTPDKEGYWALRGTLKKYSEDENKKVSAESRQATFKSFPKDLGEEQNPKE